MELYLRADVHVAVIDDDAVVLDVAGDAYLCLPGAGRELAARGADGRLFSGPLAQTLLEAGLATPEAAGSHDPWPERPTTTIIHEPRREPVRFEHLRAAYEALGELRRARQTPGLAPYLALARKNPLLSRDQDRIRAAARLFWDLGVWLPFKGECLQRSALLIAYLQRLGFQADWVFGVRLWPFSAHCWVQSDGVCLNDDVERLQAITPIMRR